MTEPTDTHGVINQPVAQACPHCGYCPHCGRSNALPYNPWGTTPWYPNPIYPYQFPYYHWTIGGTTTVSIPTTATTTSLLT